jgi:hypothetical protein
MASSINEREFYLTWFCSQQTEISFWIVVLDIYEFLMDFFSAKWSAGILVFPVVT